MWLNGSFVLIFIALGAYRKKVTASLASAGEPLEVAVIGIKSNVANSLTALGTMYPHYLHFL